MQSEWSERRRAAARIAVESPRAALAAALALAALHTWAVWGYTGLFWGDHGLWLPQDERFAGRQLPYRDFQWNPPPAGLCLVGGAARLVGTSVPAVSSITAASFFRVVTLFALLARQTVE